MNFHAHKPALIHEVPDLYASFRARRLRTATVAWVNRRMLSALGYDVLSEHDLSKAKADILNAFGFCVPLPEDSEEVFDTGWTLLYADRYGGPFGAQHGGSARAAVIGNFIVKGVGRTSLAGQGVDKYHSDGHLWLTEAIKDALYSELCWFECPYRAVPTLAIIDTGLSAQMPDGDRIGRRALLVRPFPVRVAHLERSTYFIGGNHMVQALDARRVEQMHRFVFRNRLGGVNRDDFRQIFNKLSDQIGACDFWRLSHDFTSSNSSIHGEILDFGGFYGLSNWQRVKREAYLSIDQTVFDDVGVSIKAVVSFARKYVGIAGPIDARLLVDEVVYRAGVMFRAELRAVLGQSAPVALIKRLEDLIVEYFEVSQRFTVDYTFTPPRHMVSRWLTHKTADDGEAGDMAHLRKLEEEFDSLMTGCQDVGQLGLASRLRTALKSRPMLLIENAESSILAVVSRYESAESLEPSHIDDYICETFTASRRRFINPDGDHVAVAYVSRISWDMTLFYDYIADHAVIVVDVLAGLPITLRARLLQIPSSRLQDSGRMEYHVPRPERGKIIGDWLQACSDFGKVEVLDRLALDTLL